MAFLPLVDAAAPLPFAASHAHRRRLREVWRSAGWPYQDPLEAELLAAGLLVRERDAGGRDTVRVTDAGVALLAETLQRNRAARAPHEALVEQVARELQRAGRVVWRGLALRARVGAPGPALGAPAGTAAEGDPAAAGGPLPIEDLAPVADRRMDQAKDSIVASPDDAGRWVVAMPDVYSIRHTTVEDYLVPMVHEVKVRRADLLAELRRPAKAEAYRWLAAECWFVIREGIADAQEIPPPYGVIVAPKTGPLVQLRPAARRAMRLGFSTWMALARATPEPADDHAQAVLGAAGFDDGGGAAGSASDSDPEGFPSAR